MSDPSQKQMQEAIVAQIALRNQLEGTLKLYESATMVNNADMMERYRGQLHELLDLQLDAIAEISQLTRRAILK